MQENSADSQRHFTEDMCIIWVVISNMPAFSRVYGFHSQYDIHNVIDQGRVSECCEIVSTNDKESVQLFDMSKMSRNWSKKITPCYGTAINGSNLYVLAIRENQWQGTVHCL